MFYIIDNIWYLCKYMLERIPKCTLKIMKNYVMYGKN